MAVSPSRYQYLRRLFAYTRPYKGLLVLTIAMGILGCSIGFTIPWVIGSAVDHVISPRPDNGVMPSIASRVHWLILLVSIGAATALASAVAVYGRGHFSIKLGNRVIADLRQDLFDHLNRLSLHFYSRERTGAIVSRLINDIQQASQIMNGGVILLGLDLAQIAIGLPLLLSLSWQMALACLCILPLYGITFRLLNPRVRLASERVQSQISRISGNVQERLANIALVKTSVAEDSERERFRVQNEEYYGRVVEQSSISHLVGAITDGLIHSGTMLVVGLGGYFALFGHPPLTAGDMIKFLGWLGIMYGPVRRCADINIVFQTSMAAIERVFQVFTITPEIVEGPTVMSGSPQRGEVQFEHVHFRYLHESEETRRRLDDDVTEEKHRHNGNNARANGHPISGNGPADAHAGNGRTSAPGRFRWVLHDLNLSVEAGERIALVGPSGSGKTTLVSLLPRLYDVTEGRIVIDGADLRHYSLRSLRQAIGIVQQQSLVFSGTIRENLCYGRPGVCESTMIEAARAANAHGFISALPDGYDTLLGERGVNLSGGQLQRLAIGRVLLRDPRILILDEATSALDAESEALVQEALGRVMQNRTCFIIAHRLSTVRNADRILVLHDGHIVESGSHEKLLVHNGLYARLVRHQFGPHHGAANGHSKRPSFHVPSEEPIFIPDLPHKEKQEWD